MWGQFCVLQNGLLSANQHSDQESPSSYLGTWCIAMPSIWAAQRFSVWSLWALLRSTHTLLIFT